MIWFIEDDKRQKLFLISQDAQSSKGDQQEVKRFCAEGQGDGEGGGGKR
jgi:hypothetical protein